MQKSACNHSGQTYDCAYGQVDAAGDNDIGHTNSKDAVQSYMLTNEQSRVHIQEVGCCYTEKYQQYDQYNKGSSF